MVVIFAVADVAEIGVWQERTGEPSRCTVQAPHWATPQPNLVPVRPRSSRIDPQQRGVGSTSSCALLAVDLELDHVSVSPEPIGPSICARPRQGRLWMLQMLTGRLDPFQTRNLA